MDAIGIDDRSRVTLFITRYPPRTLTFASLVTLCRKSGASSRAYHGAVSAIADVIAQAARAMQHVRVGQAL